MFAISDFLWIRGLKFKSVIESKMVKNRYPDAFIVAVSKGKIIPLSDVLKVKEN